MSLSGNFSSYHGTYRIIDFVILCNCQVYSVVTMEFIIGSVISYVVVRYLQQLPWYLLVFIIHFVILCCCQVYSVVTLVFVMDTFSVSHGSCMMCFNALLELCMFSFYYRIHIRIVGVVPPV